HQDPHCGHSTSRAWAVPTGTMQKASTTSAVARTALTLAADIRRSLTAACDIHFEFPQDRGEELCVTRQTRSKPRYFSPSMVPVSSCCDRREHLICGPWSIPIPRVPHFAVRVSRHILCRLSARHAADLYRDTAARSQTLCRAHRSTSTSFHWKYIAALVSGPLRSRDRPQARCHSRRGGSHDGMSCRSHPSFRSPPIARNHPPTPPRC